MVYDPSSVTIRPVMSDSPSVADTSSVALIRRLLAEAVRPYLWQIVLGMVFMALVAATTAATAWLMDPVVNKVFIQKSGAMLWLVGGAVLGTFLLKSVASYAQEVVLSRVGLRIVADTQRRLYAHLLDQDMAVFQSRHTGELISHFTYDIGAMRAAVSNALIGLGRDTLSLIFLIGVMVYQEWTLSLIALVVAPATIIPIERLGKRMRKVSVQTQDEMSRFNTLLSQSFQGIRVIKAYGMEAYESDRAGGLIETLFDLTVKAVRVRAAAQPIIDAFGGVAISAVIVYGGFRVIHGHTSPGAFFSFITAVLMAYQPLRALSKINAYLQEGLAAANRIFAVLDRHPAIVEAPRAEPLPRRAGDVRFDNVWFSYDGEHPALDGVSFLAPAGGVTALVGPSGAGKSTVLNLIPRFYEASEGGVLVNGMDVKHATLASLRDCLAMVSQEVVLFDDTVMQNIRYGRMEASDDEVRAAARAAAAEDFIERLPQGWETRVGEQGTRLSGGQRQRLAIARAILKDAPILLLDEATSALDTESERHIQAALRRLMANRTTIVIAHRLSTIVDADMIHVFHHGKVSESGRHDQLVAAGGLYAHLHALQFAPEAVPASD
jgi:subfamily B ATP-binding cassette protein MsbA